MLEHNNKLKRMTKIKIKHIQIIIKTFSYLSKYEWTKYSASNKWKKNVPFYTETIESKIEKEYIIIEILIIERPIGKTTWIKDTPSQDKQLSYYSNLI